MTLVKLACRDGHDHDAEGHVFGQWAATPRLQDDCTLSDEEWSVTFVPAGLCIHSLTGYMDEPTATVVASSLFAQVPNIEDATSVPDDVKQLIIGIARKAVGR